MALLEGKIDNSTYTEKKYRDPTVLEFLKKITVVEDKDLSAKYPEAVANRVTVKLADGKTVFKQVDYHKGHPKNPMSDKDVEDKFHRLTKRYLSNSQSKKLLDAIWGLQNDKTLRGLLALLRIR